MTTTEQVVLPFTVEQLVQRGEQRRAAIRAKEEEEKRVKAKVQAEKEQRLFVALVDLVTEEFPESLLPFVDFDRAGFNYPVYDGHTIYLNVPGLTRIAVGFGCGDCDRGTWFQGSAGFLVAVPYISEREDDDGQAEHYVHIPDEWPAHPDPACRFHGWEAFPDLGLALAAAREQFRRIDALTAEANQKTHDARELAAARERAKADRKAAATPGDKLLAALREYVDSRFAGLTE